MQQLGEYLLRRVIGEGGMGKVYEAEERLSRRRVALKVLRRDLAQSEEGRRLFLREMSILSHLDHTNIVRCLACIEAEGQLVMVLEHLDGLTLRDLLRHEQRLPWPRVAWMGAQIAAGLGAAHGQDKPIVHRDLKPENIMILSGDVTKVMDFGIAKILDALPSKTVHTVGTLQYMSPEQIEGRSLDARADLYCLGLVLYEMLGGQPPFASESPRQLLNLQCTQPPPRLPALQPPVPPALEQLVLALLEKDPDRRPPHADMVRAQLEQLAAGAGIAMGGAMPTPMPGSGMPTGMPMGVPTGMPMGAPTGMPMGVPTGMPTGVPGTPLPGTPLPGTPLPGTPLPGTPLPGMSTGMPTPMPMSTGTPLRTSTPEPPRSMGTIMLVEKAGQAQERRTKVGLVLGVGAVVVLLAGAGGYFALASRTPAPVESTPLAAPATQTREGVTDVDAQDEAQAEQVRRQAEAEREASKTSEADAGGADAGGADAGEADAGGADAGGADAGGADAGGADAGGAEAGGTGGSTPQTGATSGSEPTTDTAADGGEPRKRGISSLFGRIRGEDDPEPEPEPPSDGDGGRSGSGLRGLFDDESKAPGAAEGSPGAGP